MELLEPKVEDRTFLIQFWDIVSEFWNEIPWLKEIIDLKYITEWSIFKDEIFQTLWLDKTDSFTSYILTTNDRRKEYIWGLRTFSKSPEKFEDTNNEIVRKQLESADYAYITCLQIRDVLRWSNYWRELFAKALAQVLDRFEKVWWVVSHKELLPYYSYFGAKIENNIENKDNLTLITWDKN
jgi:hypothetical protein